MQRVWVFPESLLGAAKHLFHIHDVSDRRGRCSSPGRLQTTPKSSRWGAGWPDVHGHFCCLWVWMHSDLRTDKRVSYLSVSHSIPRLCATPSTVAHQAPPPTGFSRQEYGNGWPPPSPGGLPNPGIKPGFPILLADSLSSEPPGKGMDPHFHC